MRFFLVFFLTGHSLWATEVPTGFCFQPEVSLMRVQQNLGGFILERDIPKIKRLPNNCLELPLDYGRKELFERFLRSRYTLTRVYQEGKAHVPVDENLEGRKTCSLELIKETTFLKDENNAGVQNHHGFLNNQVATQTAKETSSLLLMHGLPGSISTEKEIINVTCQVTATGRFILDFSLSGVTNGLSTTLEVTPGQRLSIGQIVQELKGENKNVDIQSGVSFHKSDGGKTVQYWLQVK